MLSPSLQRIAPSVGNARTAIVLDSSPAGIPGDGTYVVGVDIRPGVYVSASSGERLSGLSGDFDDIIANGSSAGKQYVQIAPSDVFSSQECSTWTLASVAAAAPPAASHALIGTVNLRSCGRSANHISLIRHTRPGESRRRTGENRPRIAQVDSAPASPGGDFPGCGRCRPCASHRYSAPCGFGHLGSSLSRPEPANRTDIVRSSVSRRQVLLFHASARDELTPPIHRTPPGQHQPAPWLRARPAAGLCPGDTHNLRFRRRRSTFRCVRSGSSMFVFSSHT